MVTQGRDFCKNAAVELLNSREARGAVPGDLIVVASNKGNASDASVLAQQCAVKFRMDACMCVCARGYVCKCT